MPPPFWQKTVTAFPVNAVLVDPLKSDSADLPVTMMVQCKGVGGAIKFVDAAGNPPLTLNLAAGESLNVQVSRVWVTGTTATGLIGYY
ncbi:MAG TPA: hypothetical protein DCQ84_13980 [Candidatus Competibacteraceae bacterium]|nr:hypothetical protein [Candidatus Competibacteraceae bacterium]